MSKFVAPLGTLLLLSVWLVGLLYFGGDHDDDANAAADVSAVDEGAGGPGETIQHPSIGYIDTPLSKTSTDPSVHIQGWALDRQGVDGVLLRINGLHEVSVPYGLLRNDVAQVHPDYVAAGLSGFSFQGDLSPQLSDYNQVDVIVVDGNGDETLIGSRFIVSEPGKNKWRALYERHPEWAQDPFYVLHGTSGVASGGARGLAESYAPYQSPTMRIGMRVPILYMRSTLGADRDWLFDPDFDTSLTHNGRHVVDDSLNGLIDYAVKENLVVLFTLNGGVWGDAFGTVPQWDLNDHLEEDAANCQWSQYDEVFPDDYLKGLSGSMESPELARVLTLNGYADDVRRYKKRNLQAAGVLVAAFHAQHPDLFAGINLDADTYANPFFDDRWHDYNPTTIRQFREWLSGTGIYAPGALLSDYRRSEPLDLEKVNELTGSRYVSWSQVDPPREKPAKGYRRLPSALQQYAGRLKRVFGAGSAPVLPSLEEIAAESVPWIRQWELFRRHLVDVHYDDLSHWLNEAGIAPRSIYSSQGFSAPHRRALPFAVYLDSPVKNYDSGGMSIEGSVPAGGHLGVIIYGDSAANNIRMETEYSLFEAFYRADPDWAVVEYSTSDFRAPATLAGYARAYRSMRDLYNYQARFVSAMAWNGSNGSMVGQPGFAAHTALQDTPMELAMKEFMISRAYLPRRTLMWEFGTPRHLDFDRWKASTGALGGNYGSLIVKAEQRRATMVSPPQITIDADVHRLLVLGIKHTAALQSVEIIAHSAKERRSISGLLEVRNLQQTAAGVEVPINWAGTQPELGFDIEFTFSGIAPQFKLNHIVLVPASSP